MMQAIPKQTSFQIHPSQDQLNQFYHQIKTIAGQLVDPKAVVLLAEKCRTPARVRVNVKSRQLLAARRKLEEALEILQEL